MPFCKRFLSLLIGTGIDFITVHVHAIHNPNARCVFLLIILIRYCMERITVEGYFKMILTHSKYWYSFRYVTVPVRFAYVVYTIVTTQWPYWDLGIVSVWYTVFDQIICQIFYCIWCLYDEITSISVDGILAPLARHACQPGRKVVNKLSSTSVTSASPETRKQHNISKRPHFPRIPRV